MKNQCDIGGIEFWYHRVTTCSKYCCHHLGLFSRKIQGKLVNRTWCDRRRMDPDWAQKCSNLQKRKISKNIFRIPKINDFFLMRFSDLKIDRFSPRKSKMVVHDLIHHGAAQCVKRPFYVQKFKLKDFPKNAYLNFCAKNCFIIMR